MILEMFKHYFSVGRIYQHSKEALYFQVRSIKDLIKVIEHFDSYPLITKKRGDYLL
jgi:hypothetical protein